MIISFEIPTNKPRELDYIADVARGSSFKFSVCLNGNEFSRADEIRTGNLIAFYWPLRITEPCVSMMELRKAAAQMASRFDPDIRVIGDGNFQFSEGWQEYISDIAWQLVGFEKDTGETGFVGMNGGLGGTGKPGCTVNKGRKIHIPINPMIDTNRGIMYSGWTCPWDAIRVLPSGFEDHYIAAYLFRKMGIIPLKSFFSPILHPLTHLGSVDRIHDRELWKKYNMRMVRELWSAPDWSFPEKSRHFHPPRTSIQVMLSIRSRLMDSGYVFRTGFDDRRRVA